MGKRADVVFVVAGIIFVLEYKVGAHQFNGADRDQVLDYALDLKNFHLGSHRRTIVPILVATNAAPVENNPLNGSDGVLHPQFANGDSVIPMVVELAGLLASDSIDAIEWAASPYRPTPTIVEAAQALYSGHDVREISRSEAGAENLSETAAYLSSVIEDAKRSFKKAVCFITGVPGSGKTLAGLNIATARMRSHEDEHAVFLSGNGPLVDVLREALAASEVRQGRANGKALNKADAYRKASAFIQNIHHFRDDNLQTSSAPTERVVVFDEAQRAWSLEATTKFMVEKRGLANFNMSEPEFLLSVMDRHQDWCVVVCLIGGGQEINTGEAGLTEWLSALAQKYSHWDVHLSDRLIAGVDEALATYAETNVGRRAKTAPSLHLGVSIRSFRAEAVSEFVGALINGNADAAKAASAKIAHYPVFISRDLNACRQWLREQARGTERIGLAASSNGLRLKPAGIHVKAGIDPAIWFLAEKDDVRSSFALEDVATEFDIQGLELDWVGVCWDANFRRENERWGHYNFRGSRWENIHDEKRMAYLANAYRVLLTRARQGMVVFVPEGDGRDKTRLPQFYDETFTFLHSCGLSVLR